LYVLKFKIIKYIYNYTDQLGNVRLSYQNNGSGAAVLEENNYYPFGLKHEGYNYTSGNPDQYNGKELQDDTGMLDYGWRQYMPDLGRWNGIDQLAESYYLASPYAYVLNNPISFIDPDGRAVEPVADGWEFIGQDVARLFNYLKRGGNVKSLTNALGNWNGSGRVDDFWSYFGSWLAWSSNPYMGAGGAVYATVISDGAKGATSTDIQEIVFTRIKVADVQSLEDSFADTQKAWRQPGKAMMMDSMFDVLGILIVNKVEPETQTQALGIAALAVIFAKGRVAPGIIKAEEFITVRHHTSTSAVKAIKKSGSINVSSPRPFGVDVEMAPFVYPLNVKLGQASGGYLGGGYIEFTVPKWGVTPTPFIGGVGNSGRIMVEGHM